VPYQSVGPGCRTDRHSRLSIVTLLPWEWAAVGSSPEHVVAGGGVLAPPTRSATVGPCLPWSPQEADIRRLLQAMGVDGDETPQVSTSHTGTAILNLPVPLGFQPGTFGGPLLAPYLLCSRSLPDANTGRPRRPGRECPQKTAGVRY